MYGSYLEFLLGIIMFLLSAAYFYLTRKIGIGSIDSSFLPLVLSGVLFLLSLVQTMKGAKVLRQGYGSKEDLDYLTFVKTLALIILYIGSLNLLGFILSSFLFLFLEFIVLTPRDGRKNYSLYFLISLATSLVVYFLFRNGLNLILPKGILGGI